MARFAKACLVFGCLSVVLLIAGSVAGAPQIWRPAATASAACLAIGIGALPGLRTYQFTAWIAAGATMAMLYPSAFLHWGRIDLRDRWVFLVAMQSVMFGMGTQMSLRDFVSVVKAPRGVLVGIVCHFSVMPLVGFGLIQIFHFPPEIAAGVILIGSCSSGMVSNVMSYMARANLALSVTVTAVTTTIAPLLTPLLMKLLARTLVKVNVFSMMMEIVKIVIVPIGAALLHDYLKHASAGARRRIFQAAAASAAALAWLAGGGWIWLEGRLSGHVLDLAGVGGFVLAALLVGTVYHWAAERRPRLDLFAPLVSMAGTVYIITVTTAAARDNLLKVGLLLFAASVIHNAAGYFLGYGLARGAGLDRNSSRSVAFEVGLQNAALASGLAGVMGKLATVGMAPAIFGTWMNISGSLLANYWRRRPVVTPRPSAGAPPNAAGLSKPEAA